MKRETGTLTLEQVLEPIRHADEAQQILAGCDPDTFGSVKWTSLHAVYLVQSLFSEASSDRANINRITLNLETAAADLLHLSKVIRDLA